MMLRNYVDHHISSENNRQKMVFGCTEFFKVLVNLFSFEPLASSDFISVSTIYSWTAVTMAVSLPLASCHISTDSCMLCQIWIHYLRGVHDDLEFLVTPHALPDYNTVLEAENAALAAGPEKGKSSRDIFKAVRGEYMIATADMRELLDGGALIQFCVLIYGICFRIQTSCTHLGPWIFPNFERLLYGKARTSTRICWVQPQRCGF